MEEVKKIEDEIKSLEIEINALEETSWESQRKLDDMINPTNTQGESGNSAATEPTPEQKELIDKINTMRSEMTVKRIKVSALKKRLANAIANASEYFTENKEETENGND